MANIFINQPDDLEEETNINVINMHSTLSNMIKQLNYALNNLDDENMTEEYSEKLSNGE